MKNSNIAKRYNLPAYLFEKGQINDYPYPSQIKVAEVMSTKQRVPKLTKPKTNLIAIKTFTQPSKTKPKQFLKSKSPQY